MARSSIYVDGAWVQNPRATVLVNEEIKTARVTYRGENDQRFRVVFVQRANPIGFRATLPGDKRRT